MQHRNSSTLDWLLDSFTHEILQACQRHYAQCSKISALAEAIERGTASPAERDALFALLMEAVIRFELNAQTDVEAFRRVHHRVMRELLDGRRDGEDQVNAFNACARAFPTRKVSMTLYRPQSQQATHCNQINPICQKCWVMSANLQCLMIWIGQFC
ncbi:hypothetical protein R75461_08045 [Paraburkholderia nemoris]|uniref:hypothetical protein n=1 Tax=Paraburkholderia nemoris TaxID=2793076 RepID=UPI00190B89FB|nr:MULTISPECIES: hypothetical protein [Paraburkholderia]MBK3787003.1 hypothetical protein [Paraburkholderia aspalathi]CAE6862264.1 hypothetical protein R75461_08045 [Paraburkholderia nemoris]